MKPSFMFFVFFFFFAFSLPSLQADTSFGDAMGQSACAGAIKRQLEEWKIKPTWTEQPRLDPFQLAAAFLAPTQAIGVWSEVRFHPEENEITAIRFSAKENEIVRWNSKCEKEQKILPAPVQSESRGGFTDKDLETLLQTTTKGVLFVWSPHMPCSVKGLHAVLKTVQALKLPLTVLLDPASNDALARSFVKKEKFPLAALRPAQSLELRMRGMTNYPPTVQVFSKGGLSGPVFRGFQDDTNYGRFIESNL